MTAPSIPNGIVPSVGAVKVADGTNLRTLHWPAEGDPWAVALVVHGLGEHGGRYRTVAGALTAAGIEVHAYDHRGFGGSAGARAWVDRWSRFHDDLAERIVAVRATRPGLPLVIYAHSLGGLIATGYLFAGRALPLPDLVVLSAPGIASEQPQWKKTVARLLRDVAPRMRIANGLPGDGLSRDPEVRAAADADPLCLSASTVRFGAEAFAEQDRVQAALRAAAATPVPVYVLHGADDRVVGAASSEVLGRLRGVTRRVHDGLRHECHHEPEHPAVLAEVVTWIRAVVARAA